MQNGLIVIHMNQMIFQDMEYKSVDMIWKLQYIVLSLLFVMVYCNPNIGCHTMMLRPYTLMNYMF